MRKRGMVVMAVIILVFAVGWSEAKAREGILTAVSFSNNWTEKGYYDELCVYWLKGESALGVDVKVNPADDYLAVKPYLTIKLRPDSPIDLLLGLTTDSTGADYVQAGFWYMNTFGRVNALLDVRNYGGMAGETADYMEDFLRLSRAVREKSPLGIGIDIDYIRWWQSADNAYFLGPFINYKVSSTFSLFLRGSRLWVGSTTEDTLTLKASFCF